MVPTYTHKETELIVFSGAVSVSEPALLSPCWHRASGGSQPLPLCFLKHFVHLSEEGIYSYQVFPAPPIFLSPSFLVVLYLVGFRDAAVLFCPHPHTSPCVAALPHFGCQWKQPIRTKARTLEPAEGACFHFPFSPPDNSRLFANVDSPPLHFPSLQLSLSFNRSNHHNGHARKSVGVRCNSLCLLLNNCFQCKHRVTSPHLLLVPSPPRLPHLPRLPLSHSGSNNCWQMTRRPVSHLGKVELTGSE